MKPPKFTLFYRKRNKGGDGVWDAPPWVSQYPKERSRRCWAAQRRLDPPPAAVTVTLTALLQRWEGSTVPTAGLAMSSASQLLGEKEFSGVLQRHRLLPAILLFLHSYLKPHKLLLQQFLAWWAPLDSLFTDFSKACRGSSPPGTSTPPVKLGWNWATSPKVIGEGRRM